jgi:hypothetical protein
MFGPKIAVPQELMDRLKRCAEVAGYSSAEEFAIDLLERGVAQILQSDEDDQAVEERLRGLGYIE